MKCKNGPNPAYDRQIAGIGAVLTVGPRRRLGPFWRRVPTWATGAVLAVRAGLLDREHLGGARLALVPHLVSDAVRLLDEGGDNL